MIYYSILYKLLLLCVILILLFLLYTMTIKLTKYMVEIRFKYPTLLKIIQKLNVLI